MNHAIRSAFAALMGAPAILLLGLSILFCVSGDTEGAKVALFLSAAMGMLALAISPAAQ